MPPRTHLVLAATLAALLIVATAPPAAAQDIDMEEFLERLRKTSAEAEKRIAVIEHKELVMEFQEATARLTHSVGEPKEQAERLAVLTEKIDRETADGTLKDWQAADKYAEQAGVTQATLKPEGDGEKTFKTAVATYMEANKEVSLADATKAIQKSDPDLYMAQRPYTSDRNE